MGHAAPIRVLHLISDAGPHPYFRTLIEAGGADRRALSVGCVGPAGALQEDMDSLGVATFALGARARSQYPHALARLARKLTCDRIQIVQTHLVDGCLVGLGAARLARVPVRIMTAHHSHELPFHGRRLLWPDRLCAGPLSTHVIAPSQTVADTLVSYTGVARTKLAVIHHGFDFDRFDPARVTGDRVRAELGLDDALIFGAIGRLYHLKNYESLVHAFALASEHLADARLVIVGSGDPEPVLRLAGALGIGDRITILSPREDIDEVLAAFDVFVHPAIAESFGMVIVEAMAMARPVLSTAVGIAPSLIESGRTGVLAKSLSPEGLRAGLAEIVALRPRWAEIGSAARARVAHLTAVAMTERHEDLYDEWLSGASGSARRRTRDRSA